MRYQEVFQGLKGAGPLDLSSLCLPVEGTEFILTPINCSPEGIDGDVVVMLTEARNSNAASFLTYFIATPERTSRWIENSVGPDSARILFSLKNLRTGTLYGYMGLAYGDSNGDRIEGDAIVRFATESLPGLMRKAFLRLVNWVKSELGIREVWVRVLSDNPATEFYKSCGFVVDKIVPLFEVRGPNGELLELSESGTGDLVLSPKTLCHMRYSI